MKSLTDHLAAVAATKEKFAADFEAHVKAFAEPLAVIAKTGVELTGEQISLLQEAHALIAGLLPAEEDKEVEAVEPAPVEAPAVEAAEPEAEEKAVSDETMRAALELIRKQIRDDRDAALARVSGRID